MAIKFIYTLFLALLVALFVGLGIDAFYPVELENVKSCCEETTEQKEIRIEFEQTQRNYQEVMKPYNRNISIISLIAAIIILVISLTFLNKIKMIADGLLLGGVFTTMYSIIRGVMTENSQFRFLIVTIGVIIAFVLGYVKFIRHKDDTQ